MSLSRQCSRTACSGGAVATLTYVYSEQTAVLGPLAIYAEPHTYDLCVAHAKGLTVPRGWDVIRLLPELVDAGTAQDDLVAVADAVREAARLPQAPAGVETGRRGHLRVLPDR